MRCLLVALLLVPVLPAAAQRATVSDAPLSDRRVAYIIDAVLDPDARTVTATQRLTWRNPDAVPVDTLQFHLYLNAFRDAHSTFMRESGGSHRGFVAEGDGVWGGVEIDRLAVAGGPELTAALRFIHPDGSYPEDRTVAEVVLPEPVAPGETVELELAFTARLPKIFARTGWEEKADGSLFFMVAQWFPKLGVYEVPGQRYVPADAPRGRWSTHAFHANSEFYADFGTYDVTLTVPAGYVVGASGVRTAERATDSTRTVVYRAEDVHDFAWTASPSYLEYTDRWEHVDLRLLLQPEHEGQAARHFDAAKAALARFADWVGPYPYTTLTLVDGVGGSNGMEYPTLITCGTVYQLPGWLRALELVTIHEFGHQYFYGLLASNEAEEAWLDEGINSYLELRIMDDAYGPGAVLDLPGLRVSDGAFQRLSYTKNRPSTGVIATRSWEHTYSSDYGKTSYAKPATVLKTLENHLGWDVMQEILQTYYARWRFRHPTTRDFIAVAEEVAGRPLDWFFDQYVYDDAVVDYAVDALTRRTVEVGDSTAVRSTVRLQRREDGVFPQVLRVTYDDGRTEDVDWDGEAAWHDLTFDGRVVDAHLDPDDHVWLDVDRLNNRRAAPDDLLARKQQLKATVWLQQLLVLAAGLL